jgi:hypothetical protein
VICRAGESDLSLWANIFPFDPTRSIAGLQSLVISKIRREDPMLGDAKTAFHRLPKSVLPNFLPHLD